MVLLTEEQLEALVRRAVEPLRDEIARLHSARSHEEGVSIAEAAKLLGVSEKTVKRGIKDESIPSTKVRGRRIVLLGELIPSSEHAVRVAHRARRG